MNVSYIALKHVIWRFRICNYFREIFKFRDLMNIFRNFAKSVFAHVIAKFKYFAKQFILTESVDVEDDVEVVAFCFQCVTSFFWVEKYRNLNYFQDNCSNLA